MEQFYNDSLYTIDLGEINTAHEIIFELSSVLDKEETRNKRICLKLGKVDLTQAQLISIKSLINGIDSSLSAIETKSSETEKVALALGIIVSNASAENISEITPSMPYKLAEELKEQENDVIVEEQNIEQENSIEETDKSCENIIDEESLENQETTKVQANNEENIEEVIEEDLELEKNSENDISKNVQDELDAIFSSSPAQNTFYEMESKEPEYAEKEELADIVVPEIEYTKEDIELETFPTKYIKQTIRSGQVINYDGNIVIIGDCHPGCEITAFGDITVWGVLSGIAHAGAGGNQKARVRALKMNAIQLRIASCYSRRPDSLNTVYIEKTNSFTPEEARIINGEIVVFKIND